MGNFRFETPNIVFGDKLMDYYYQLSEKPHKSGKEGTAFFFENDKNNCKSFVVKRIYTDESKTVIDQYCREIYNFGEKSYLSVPRIYSWLIADNYNSNIHYRNVFYVLQDKIEGYQLFQDNFAELNDDTIHLNLNNKNQFFVESELNDDEIMENLVLNYIEHFIRSNKRVSNLSDEESSKFINTIYYMFQHCCYSVPDVHGGNVLYDKASSKMTLIDNYFVGNQMYSLDSEKACKFEALKAVFAVFSNNVYVNQYAEFFNQKVGKLSNNIQNAVKKNYDECVVAMRKFIDVAKNILELKGPISDDDLLAYLNKVSIKCVGEDRANYVMEELNK